LEGAVSDVTIGTSGWSYKSWKSCFYPQDIPKRPHIDANVRAPFNAQLLLNMVGQTTKTDNLSKGSESSAAGRLTSASVVS